MTRVLAKTVTLLILATFSAYGQYGEMMNAVVSENPLTLGSAALLLGNAAGTVDQFSTSEAALDQIRGLGVRFPDGDAASAVDYGDLALIITQLWDLRGGLLYEIVPTRRSAFRELVSRNVVAATSRPGQYVSGPEALLILRRIVAVREEEDE
ncbi:MAG: hypothetical protein GVY29_04415 [Spirochaetes bacterium]|jgi:hypothetical protein|nr:hypothetical protein [Spirochaetota bacterium]